MADRRPVTSTHHGRTRTDEYDWLRDKEDSAVIAHLEAENAWTEQATAHLEGLREQIFSEIRTRTQETDLSVPVRNRGYWHYMRTFEGREYPSQCRVPVADPADWTPPEPDQTAGPDTPALPGEELLLDHNALAEGHDFFSLGGASISPHTTLLAYAVDVTGDERYTIRVKDLSSGGLLDDEITGVLGGATWHPDGDAFYYVTVDETWRADKVWRHQLGTPQSEDELVFAEPDGRFWVGVGRTATDRFLMVVSGSKTTTEWRYLDTARPELGWRTFAARRTGIEYSLEHAVIGGQDRFLVLHNASGADFELALAGIDPTEEWSPLIPHVAGTRLEDVSAHAGHLVVHQRSEGLSRLRVLELDDTGIAHDHLVQFDDEIYTIGGGSNPEFGQPTVRFGYTTLATPASVYDYHVATRELTLLRRTPVLSGGTVAEFNDADYEQHRIWAKADDGVLVPISLVVRRGLRADGGPIPVLLYGYGSYEHSIDPGFSIPRLSMLDRGAAFAIAHVRGGGEMGRHWYDDGKLDRKTNTFDDFVACARTLIAEGWTSPDLLVAEGGSAGGLLMGAVANRAPELFTGIVAAVPFVDALTSMLDSTLPLTVSEYEEWGNPEADPEVYDYMASYAPYDNVVAQDYPAILAETSLNDTRVLYVEPAKWIARLRATATSHQFLLRTEMSAGHGGVSGRYRAWKDRAFTLAWILDQMGLATAPD